MRELAEWESFYLIVGSAAGAMVGLQFVVMTLIAGRPVPLQKNAADAFATPTIVHFGAAFILSSLVRVPWQKVLSASLAWGIIGVVGLVYSIIVLRRMIAQTSYEPEFEDWLFHIALPIVSYVVLIASAVFGLWDFGDSLYGVAATSLLLLVIGIHNAWDAVTYNLFVLDVADTVEEQLVDNAKDDEH